MMEVAGHPLIYWITRRLQSIGNVVLATTSEQSDDYMASYVGALGDVPVYRGSKNENDDVVSRINSALEKHCPDAEFVLRGLGDCPLMAHEVIQRSVRVLEASEQHDSFAWALPPWIWPVYGSREFPYRRNAWDLIYKESTEREHPDMFFHKNRDKFNTVFHEPPRNAYFRPYRLEVDWLEDMQLMREVASGITLLAPIKTIIAHIDANESLQEINRMKVEQTGPTKYSHREKIAWHISMRGKPIMGWDNNWWNVKDDSAEPIFCEGGTCLLGSAVGGEMYRRNGDIITGDAIFSCDCGANRMWHKAK